MCNGLKINLCEQSEINDNKLITVRLWSGSCYCVNEDVFDLVSLAKDLGIF